MFRVPERSDAISVWARLLITDEPTLNDSILVVILNCLGVVDVEKLFAEKTGCLSFQLVSGYYCLGFVKLA